MRRLAPLAVLAAALLAAGCGGDASDDAGGGGGGGAKAATGEALFKGNCGSCHTLAAAGTNGSFGPNLDELEPDEQTVLTTIKTGPGPMPAGIVKGADAAKVATYVSENAG